MEFKKSKKHNKKRLDLNSPRAGASTSFSSHLEKKPPIKPVEKKIPPVSKKLIDDIKAKPIRLDEPVIVKKQPGSANESPDSTDTKTIDISIKLNAPSRIMPSIAVIQSQARRLFKHKKLLIVGAVAVTVGISAFSIAPLLRNQNTDPQKSDPVANQNEIIENIEYQTVIPNDKSIGELGGWKRVSPPGKDPVYAYVDKINDIGISVSQQPLPSSFTGDVDNQVAEVAKKFNATNKIEEGGTDIYVGTSAKGPQSAILTKNGLLILIKSTQKIDDASWIKYTKSLN